MREAIGELVTRHTANGPEIIVRAQVYSLFTMEYFNGPWAMPNWEAMPANDPIYERSQQ